jgi:hypothetical protein
MNQRLLAVRFHSVTIAGMLAISIAGCSDSTSPNPLIKCPAIARAGSRRVNRFANVFAGTGAAPFPSRAEINNGGEHRDVVVEKALHPLQRSQYGVL